MEPINNILTSLEELGQITSESSVFEIKPFRDWKATKWQHKVFGMRLCNAGETLDIAKYCDEIPETARSIVSMHETLIRSIWSIDKKALITAEELKKYNDQHKSTLSEHQYLRGWIQRVEDIVVERLNSVYVGLQLKQIRMLNGTLSCGYCGTVYTEENVPEGSFVLKYNIAEIICSDCKDKIIQADYDFEQDAEEVTKPEEVVSETKTEASKVLKEPQSSFDYSNYICKCGKELESLEEFTTHRESCPKAL
jgi:hypothetical protein